MDPQREPVKGIVCPPVPKYGGCILRKNRSLHTGHVLNGVTKTKSIF